LRCGYARWPMDATGSNLPSPIPAAAPPPPEGASAARTSQVRATSPRSRGCRPIARSADISPGERWPPLRPGAPARSSPRDRRSASPSTADRHGERPLGVADPLIRLPGVDRQDLDVGITGQHPPVVGDAVGKVVPLLAQSIAQAISRGADLPPADQIDEVCHQTFSSSSLLKLTRAMDQACRSSLGAAGRGSTPRSPGGSPTRWRHPGGHDPPSLACGDRAAFALMSLRARAPHARDGGGEPSVPCMLDVTLSLDHLEEPELVRTERVGNRRRDRSVASNN